MTKKYKLISGNHRLVTFKTSNKEKAKHIKIDNAIKLPPVFSN